MAVRDDTPTPRPTPTPGHSLPALRTAGSARTPSRAATLTIVGLMTVAIAAITLLLLRPWASERRLRMPDPSGDTAQARFDLERQPEIIIRELAIGPGSRVADIGADKGQFTKHLAKAVRPGGRVVATDIDAGVLNYLAERLDNYGLGDVVETRVVPPDSPGLESAAYDVILLSHIDHLLADPVAWLRAAKPALKPNGRIAITNLNQQRAKGVAAAERAGLTLVRESHPTPIHYLAIFVTGNSH